MAIGSIGISNYKHAKRNPTYLTPTPKRVCVVPCEFILAETRIAISQPYPCKETNSIQSRRRN